MAVTSAVKEEKVDCAGPGAGAGLEVAGGFLEHVGERP